MGGLKVGLPPEALPPPPDNSRYLCDTVGGKAPDGLASSKATGLEFCWECSLPHSACLGEPGSSVNSVCSSLLVDEPPMGFLVVTSSLPSSPVSAGLLGSEENGVRVRLLALERR